MTSMSDLFSRLRRHWKWVAGQFGGSPLLILLFFAWTRIPEKHLWQVALTLLLPVLLAISALELQAGTVRALADNEGGRVKLIWGAITLLVWIAIACAFWALLDWCDDQIPLWAGYLNSKASAAQRVGIFSYIHLTRDLHIAEWFLRWIALPAKLIPFASGSALWGWSLPFRRLIRLICTLRWWLGVVVAALVGVAIPELLFSGVPSGTVSTQVWSVVLKLIASYLLAVSAWVALLSWLAVLLARRLPPAEEVLVPVPAGAPDGGKQASEKLPLP